MGEEQNAVQSGRNDWDRYRLSLADDEPMEETSVSLADSQVSEEIVEVPRSSWDLYSNSNDHQPQLDTGHSHDDFVPSSADRHPSAAGKTHLEPPTGVVGNAGAQPNTAFVPSGSLRREYRKLHIFAATINAVIGSGIYVNTGTIQHLGGPAAVIYSYAFLGALALMIMHNMAIMLHIWPTAGALIVFVEKFVDEEVGKTVAVLYWLTYCFSWASMTIALDTLVESLRVPFGSQVAVTVFSLVLPVVVNLTDSRILKRVQVILAFLKLATALAIIIIMNIINPTVEPREVIFREGGNGYGSWFGAIMSSILIASFSYIGIEVVAATAQEASFDIGRRYKGVDSMSIEEAPGQEGQELAPWNGGAQDLDDERPVTSSRAKYPFRGPAISVPLIATVAYLWGGWIVSENVNWDNKNLPDLQWTRPSSDRDGSNDIFIIAASAVSDRLAYTITALLILMVAFTSVAALYVSSRTLFGFAYTIAKRHENEPRVWWLKVARFVAEKNKFDVPWIAVLVSAWLFWLPFLRYWLKGQSSDFLVASSVITEMSSMSCVLVWAFESLAAFRFYRCYKKHVKKQTPSVPRSIRKTVKINNSAWYYSHLAMSGLSFVLCLAIVFVGGPMLYMHNPNPVQGVASFIIASLALLLSSYVFTDKAQIAIFIILTAILKLLNWNRMEHKWLSWETLRVDLGDAEKVTKLFQDLEDHSKHHSEQHQRQTMSFWDLGGILNSERLKTLLFRQ
ncbi:amino acid permease-domain-containing protein [Xylariaceae sp. FL0016]|nr:amino acid permease-domain-containing protein [Xylariaceae sp. FL0016]